MMPIPPDAAQPQPVGGTSASRRGQWDDTLVSIPFRTDVPVSIPIREETPAATPVEIIKPRKPVPFEDREVRRAKAVMTRIDRLEMVRKFDADQGRLRAERATAARRFHERLDGA